MNEDFPEIVQIVNGEAPQGNASQSQARALSLGRSKTLQAIRLNTYVDNASDTIALLEVSRLGLTRITCRLVRRASSSNAGPNDSPSFTETAIHCSDSVDMRGTTMEQVFKGIISTAQNVTHICELRAECTCDLQRTLTACSNFESPLGSQSAQAGRRPSTGARSGLSGPSSGTKARSTRGSRTRSWSLRTSSVIATLISC